MAFWNQSIRARLTFWYSLLVLSSLLLFGGLSYYFTGRTLSENLDISLKNEVRWVRNFVEPQAGKVKQSKRSLDAVLRRQANPHAALNTTGSDSTAQDTTAEQTDEIWNQIFRHTLQSRKKTYIQFSDHRGSIIYRSYNLGTDSLAVADSLELGVTRVTTTRFNGEPVRIAALKTRNFAYLVGYPVGEVSDLLDSLYVIFLVLIPIALAVSVFGGFALAKNTLRPVDDITTRARRITAQNLDQSIPVRNPDDEIGRLAGTINAMITRLRESFAQVKQFSADASHELRTPLTIMRGEIELGLRSTKTPEEYHGVLESTLEEIMRMTVIVDNLLMLAKADQGTYTAEFSEVNLHELVDELYEDSEVLAERKHIHMRLKTNTPITIIGDRIRLRQLFLNLIDNAIKYTPEGGSVTLSVERDDDGVLFEVADTGIGIPRADQGKIFDRFYRVDKARSREMGGSGLGLSIAKWIAELHRGSISVASAPRRGTIFTVTLPIN
jgi:heavy metal sensor kinase